MSSSRVQLALLTVIVCLGAWLRFAGIEHGVRRGSPDMDEQNNVVRPVLEMWSKGTANPGVRIGYAGFFNYLAFLPVGIGRRVAGEAGAYIAGRALVSVFGVLSIVLVYRLARGLAGPWPALLAASIQTFNRGEVRHSHYITPELVVVSGVLLVLLVSGKRPLTVGRALAAGAVCGLTIAVKYTGLLALPGLLATLVVERFPRKPALAAIFAVPTAFAVAAPYAVLRISSPVVGSGLGSALKDYYSPAGYAAKAAENPDYARPAATESLGYLAQNVGPVGLGLAALSVFLFRPVARLLPAAAVAATSLAVVLPARLVYPRHLLVPSAVLALLAACGLHGLLGRVKEGHPRRLAAIVAAAVVIVPLGRNAVSLAARFTSPSSIDLAARFIEESMQGHALVATGLPRFMLSADRFEVRSWAPLRDLPPGVLGHYDLVVAPREELAALPVELLREFDDGSGPLAVARPHPASLTRVVPTRIGASQDERHAEGPWLGTSRWRSPEGSAWISAQWREPRPIERVEVLSDEAGGLRPQWLVLEGLEVAGGSWKKLEVWPLRPGMLSRQSRDAPGGQIYVMAPPARLVGLRLSSEAGTAWGLARIVVLASGDELHRHAAADR